ncbi:MAG: hypothetical protein SGJ04_03745, partial [Bacteroidota bacterium]|nr:hypothetical protein [Bacteroidota bacterium]
DSTVKTANKINKESFYYKLYLQGKKNQDPYTQIVAINSMLVEDSLANAGMQDTLAMIYAGAGLDKSTKQVLKERTNAPESEDMDDLKIMTSKTPEEAMQTTRELYKKSPKLRYLFIMAGLQIQMQKFADADATFNKIEAHKNYKTEKIPSTMADGKEAKIPAEAALYMLKAQNVAAQGKLAQARIILENLEKKYPNLPQTKLMFDQLNQMSKSR